MFRVNELTSVIHPEYGRASPEEISAKGLGMGWWIKHLPVFGSLAPVSKLGGSVVPQVADSGEL